MEIFYKETAGVTDEELKKTLDQLSEYTEFLQQKGQETHYEAPESSINLPIDSDLAEQVKKLHKQKVSKKLQYVLVIGIGGSSLGTKAIYDAIFGATDSIDLKRFPRIIFLETNDPEYLRRLKNFLQIEIKSPEEILINIISKSGTTTETVANAEIVIEILKGKFPIEKIYERTVVTTDEGSKLWKWAEAENISRLSIPKVVGGRYSVFSAVGLFPMACVGIDVEALREGAASMRKKCIDSNEDYHPAMISAALLYLNFQKGKTINDNFFFSLYLESIGRWYRQLMGESIGKEQDKDGKTVNTGITPIVSVGSNDLHSVGQLYLGGPRDKFTTFVWARNEEDPMNLPKDLVAPGLVKNLEGNSAQSIMSAILEGVKTAYSKKELPFMEIVLSEVGPFAVGEFMQFKMIEMMYLGKLMNVNTFDQPNVELYKVETKKILSTHGTAA